MNESGRKGRTKTELGDNGGKGLKEEDELLLVLVSSVFN